MIGYADEEFRAAAIEHVRQLRELHAGRIPSATLTKRLNVGGVELAIWNQQKGIFKPAIFGRDGAALSVQTSARSPYGDIHDLESGHITYKYRGADPGHPDNVALRQAYWTRRPIIYLVAIDPGYYDAVLPVYVIGDDPDALQFTLMADQLFVGEHDAERVTDPSKVAARREYATRAVLVRLHQHRFRRDVLSAYGNRCTICRLGHVRLLDAAHILPDKSPMGEPVIPNGLGLCKIHHSAYDARIIGIDPNARVHVNKRILEEEDGPMLRHGLQEINNQQLVLPRRKEHRPDPAFLAKRFALYSER